MVILFLTSLLNDFLAGFINNINLEIMIKEVKDSYKRLLLR